MERLPSEIVAQNQKRVKIIPKGRQHLEQLGEERERERRWFVDGALPVRTNPNSCVVNLRDTASGGLVTEAVTGKRGHLGPATGTKTWLRLGYF